MRFQGKFEEKASKIKITPENIDDLWVLNTIIDKGDLVRSKTIRKINLGEKNSEKSKVIKKKVFLGLNVEKVEFKENILKILGEIVEGPEDIPRGSFHSFNIEANDNLEIEKEWLSYQIKKLKDSVNKKDVKLLVCLFNREEAIFGKLERSFIRKTSSIKGNVQKKDYDQKINNFFEEITNIVDEMNSQTQANFIIFGSSNFWIPNIKKEIEKKEFKKKCIFTTVNSVSESGFNELLSKQEIISALKDLDAIKDKKIIDEIFKLISNESNVAYGLKDCEDKANIGAIKELICTENLIGKLREENNFEILETIFKNTELNRGDIHIISGNSEANQKLDGLGGIAAKLRF